MTFGSLNISVSHIRNDFGNINNPPAELKETIYLEKWFGGPVDNLNNKLATQVVKSSYTTRLIIATFHVEISLGEKVAQMFGGSFLD